MRAICNVCQHKDTCSYLKRGRESDCIDVQTSDYGYEEAVEKACYVFAKAVEKLIPLFPTEEARTTVVEQFRKQFRKAIEL